MRLHWGERHIVPIMLVFPLFLIYFASAKIASILQTTKISLLRVRFHPWLVILSCFPFKRIDDEGKRPVTSDVAGGTKAILQGKDGK